MERRLASVTQSLTGAVPPEASMQLAKSLGLFAHHAAFRAASAPASGRALLRALESDDETTRTIAGMFLVKSGRKSIPYLREALAELRSVPIVLQILADIGDPSVEPDIAAFLHDSDAEVRRAANDALETLRFTR
jgi:HEAT repeat protein